MYLRKKEDPESNAQRRGYSNDFDKNILKFIGSQIARKSYEAYPQGEEISQVLVNHCMMLHLNGSRVNKDFIPIAAAEFLTNLNLTKVGAFVAAVDAKDDLLTGNSNIWQVSLEDGKVLPSYLFSGYVAKLKNKTVSRH